MTQERRERFQGRSDALTSDEEARLLHQSAAAEARFQGLIEVAPDAIVEVDGNGTIVLINGQTEMLFGYPRNELLGKPVDLLLPERFRQAHAGHRSGYMRSPHIRPMGAQLELLGRRKDGSEFPVEISLGPVDMDGDTAIVATIRDVTRRVQTEEALRNQADELRRQSNLIDLANDAIIVLDTNRVVLSWNHGAERIYGWTSDEAQGRVLNDMLQTRYPDSFEAVERALASGGHWDGVRTAASFRSR